jgi:WD40 repeat protein
MRTVGSLFAPSARCIGNVCPNMASSKPSGAFKFQEFAAHSSAVRCAAIGRKSNQVIATGGEDRKVNVWALGKPQPVLRLTGHTSSVECVAFDAEEEVGVVVHLSSSRLCRVTLHR